ncbi:NADH dehydrogenase I chain C [Thiobacillus denitrificans ATCC 25259]|uniref:NADH-quinone oxidoreductase subunit C n=1 Tax=Thiobacillus denitrificans (strain ATCC 25259 / T1) TaxID=292415 RepID=NUOC_THIDA|nr:NADH-quinone oxidoreductase subunit C [Thiobacillus denitrificans]Q3SEX6.1 RecName: Full=NADH-quinone oxidoreductase subunit C; AltName: Full=NADH dehydrogenase I subunit C; AltName: Full=NDH-1 subunit C [Thiobacillus denitrificans ATCC 25259]AAZ97097.1 NADH dehydrogenase I chain C [Thiobacillus denitrificans ATCC 25259]
MSITLESLSACLKNALGDALVQTIERLGELTLVVKPQAYAPAMLALRDHPDCRFEQLIDLCGVDYSGYGEGAWEGPRFAVVAHLLSVSKNARVRVRVFCPDDDLPAVASVVDIWPAASWFEREAFDLYGIVFEGHPDLRRILTDYGFIGHPFRKDFPLSGNVEMRYDPTQQRVIYQPVSIEPRDNVPRVVRDESYGDGRA